MVLAGKGERPRQGKRLRDSRPEKIGGGGKERRGLDLSCFLNCADCLTVQIERGGGLLSVFYHSPEVKQMSFELCRCESSACRKRIKKRKVWRNSFQDFLGQTFEKVRRAGTRVDANKKGGDFPPPRDIVRIQLFCVFHIPTFCAKTGSSHPVLEVLCL